MQDYPIEDFQVPGETKSRRCLCDRRRAAKKKSQDPITYLESLGYSVKLKEVPNPGHKKGPKVSVKDTRKSPEHNPNLGKDIPVKKYDLNITKITKPVKGSKEEIVEGLKQTVKEISNDEIDKLKAVVSESDRRLQDHLVNDLGEPVNMLRDVIDLKERRVKESYQLTLKDIELIITVTAAEVYLGYQDKGEKVKKRKSTPKLKKALEEWLAPHEVISDISLLELELRRDKAIRTGISSKVMGMNLYRDSLLVKQRLIREAM